MVASTPETETPSGQVVVCTYRVRSGEEAAFERLLEEHIPTLRGLELIANGSTQTLRHAGEGLPVYVEVFEWIDADAAARAHEVPDVIAVWEPMAALCEERDGLPGLEFPHFDRIAHTGSETQA